MHRQRQRLFDRLGFAAILGLFILLLSHPTLLRGAQGPGPGPTGGRGPGGRGPTVTTTDLGGGLTLISAGSNSVLAVGRDGAVLIDSTFGAPAFVAKVAECLSTRFSC